MKQIFQIRVLQLKRELIKAGWWAILVALIIYVLVVIKILNESEHFLSQKGILIILLSIIITIHFARKDKKLLKQILPVWSNIFISIEYCLFGLPLLIPFVFIKFYLGIVLFLVGCFFIAHLEFSIDLRFKNHSVLLNRFISSANFEWIAGMRKIQYLIIILYVIGIFLSFYHFSGFIILGVITYLFSRFYEDCESLFVLFFEYSFSKIFLLNKLKSHLWHYTKFVSTYFVCYIIQYPDKYIFFLPLLLVYYTNFTVFILNKYKSYIPNKRLNSNSIIAGLSFLGMLLPYLFPISFILIFVFYYKSIRNLEDYFHA